MFSGRAQVVENHSQLACALFPFPSVVVLKSYIRKIHFKVSPTRNTIFHRDKYVCQYCHNRFSKSKLTLDHVIPKSKGGDKSWTNLVSSCGCCNQKKADKTPFQSTGYVFPRTGVNSTPIYAPSNGISLLLS